MCKENCENCDRIPSKEYVKIVNAWMNINEKNFDELKRNFLQENRQLKNEYDDLLKKRNEKAEEYILKYNEVVWMYNDLLDGRTDNAKKLTEIKKNSNSQGSENQT